MSRRKRTGNRHPDETDDWAVDTETASQAELVERLELLAQENQRLRQEYARSRQVKYRRMAAGFVAVGVVALLAGVVFPATRTVFVALGGTGLFIGILTYYLTPETFIPVTIGEAVYETAAVNHARLTAELGLHDEFVYVPMDVQSLETNDAVRLFVPQYRDYTVPDSDDLESHYVITDAESSRGVSLQPTGAPLLREFERAATQPLSADPPTLADQLSDGLVEQFELVESVQMDVETTTGTVTASVTNPIYGSVERFDHPVASFLAVGTAYALDATVRVQTTPADGDRADAIIVCHWATEATEERPNQRTRVENPE